MDKHTPGPWTAIDRSHVYSEGLQLVAVAQHGRSVEADARLIAAAPELLEAAQQAESLIPHLIDLDLSPASQQVVAMLRSAIAKVTGEQA